MHEHPHDHSHGHDHGHDHGHAHEVDDLNAVAADTSVPDSDLSPAELSRRGLLRAAGITGAAVAGIAGMRGVTPAMAEPGATPARGGRPGSGAPRHWLAGDHHIHTQYSSDGQYRVIDQAQHAAAYGLDWLVITDHGGATHARIGVDLVNPDIRAAREELPDTLIFQGLEWNIPAAEHGTVFVAPGPHEVEVLKQFENAYDGSVKGASGNSPANEALAVAGVQWLGQQVDRKRVADALFLANHPARNGIDSPHEIRAWRDADPRIAIGFEGAPGHQAAGLPKGYGPGSARGYYGNAPGPASFAGYPPESYRTWGGFDWMTSTVGGLWDSLLAEGKPWSITANSDSHVNWTDTPRRPDGSSSEQFNRDGRYGDPVYAGRINLDAGDFWPGFYSRTHVGASSRDYRAVMRGMRDGRIWVDHGGLVKSIDVTVRSTGGRGRDRNASETLGGTLMASRGSRLELVVRITAQDVPNWSQFVPSLNRVDVVRGKVELPSRSADRDRFTAPDSKVVAQTDTSGRTGTYTLTYDLGRAEEPFYVRLRGTDGNRSQPGYLGAAVDPAGPQIDVVGDADPWVDLWFYTNPIWVVPTR
ncbi:PHP domain-containing protein [Nocardioides deserti]|uniref:Histidinol-phosphatase n=1 Tax=Nocardioides deserti TaxID=1588644 RepID=A0ABR6U489_9ACTN|nr:PHP domain-containing protein [Nocardioides deserti]MBC2959224.1 histidinol-phosphatase [Nocardioides deserti]GGO68345.1 histidinol-phosphatase [Nocardioides deserti]